jgi:hypothetical protein
MTTSRRKFCAEHNEICRWSRHDLFGALPAMSCTNLFNNKLVVGLIGCRGQGFSNLREFIALEDVEIKALV